MDRYGLKVMRNRVDRRNVKTLIARSQPQLTYQNHTVSTPDGYILTLHRLACHNSPHVVYF